LVSFKQSNIDNEGNIKKLQSQKTQRLKTQNIDKMHFYDISPTIIQQFAINH